MVYIKTTLGKLWNVFGNNKDSGRGECPITVRYRGEATHIYRGYGVIRLEKIKKLESGKKGFQGEEIAKGTYDAEITIED